MLRGQKYFHDSRPATKTTSNLVISVDAIANGHPTLHSALATMVAIAWGAGLGHLALIALVAVGTTTMGSAVGAWVAGATMVTETWGTHLQLALGPPVLKIALTYGAALLNPTSSVAGAVVGSANGHLTLVSSKGSVRAVAERQSVR